MFPLLFKFWKDSVKLWYLLCKDYLKLNIINMYKGIKAELKIIIGFLGKFDRYTRFYKVCLLLLYEQKVFFQDSANGQYLSPLFSKFKLPLQKKQTAKHTQLPKYINLNTCLFYSRLVVISYRSVHFIYQCTRTHSRLPY